MVNGICFTNLEIKIDSSNIMPVSNAIETYITNSSNI